MPLPPSAAPLIRVAVVDDHPAMRLGLQAALEAEAGLAPVGAAESGEELAPLLYRVQPDVVLLDYHLPGRDGLAICREVKFRVPAPGVLLYSAFVDAALLVPAIVAGADGVVPKGASQRELFQAIRAVAAGGTALPELPAEVLHAAGSALDPDDAPILGLLVARASLHEIADALRLDASHARARILRMLDSLRAPAGRERALASVTGPRGATR
jgi:DNA-binding NarL/FixJ family response regulator